MLELGRYNILTVKQTDNEGLWLQSGHELVLLPQSEKPPELEPGAKLAVFVYADRDGVPTATLRQPLAQAGEFAYLRVSQVNSHGAFLDWGLEKDLLVPPKEQPEMMRPGRRYLVKVRLDRHGRAIGSARIQKSLSSHRDELQVGEQVDLIIWRFTELGAKVIINHRFEGLLYRDEIGNRLQIGEQLQGFIQKIRGDQKIDVTLRPATREGLEGARAELLTALQESGGTLPLHDHSSPDEIQQALGMSKKTFKKAVGGLYKAGLITLHKDGIRLKD